MTRAKPPAIGQTTWIDEAVRRQKAKRGVVLVTSIILLAVSGIAALVVATPQGGRDKERPILREGERK